MIVKLKWIPRALYVTSCSMLRVLCLLRAEIICTKYGMAENKECIKASSIGSPRKNDKFTVHEKHLATLEAAGHTFITAGGVTPLPRLYL